MESLLTPAPASNKFCIFTKVLHLSEVHRRSELSHLSEVRSRQSTTSHNIIRLLRSSQKKLKPQMPEVFHICFVNMNKSTVYFSLAFIHVLRLFVVALSLHLSRGRLCLRVHCLIDGILLFCVHTHLFSVLLLHRCVLFVFPLSLYHSQRTSTPCVCMSISVGNRIYGIFLFCIKTHRSVLFVVTPSSCCPYNVQSERLLQVGVCVCIFRESINEDADGTFQ